MRGYTEIEIDSGEYYSFSIKGETQEDIRTETEEQLEEYFIDDGIDFVHIEINRTDGFDFSIIILDEMEFQIGKGYLNIVEE